MEKEYTQEEIEENIKNEFNNSLYVYYIKHALDRPILLTMCNRQLFTIIDGKFFSNMDNLMIRYLHKIDSVYEFSKYVHDHKRRLDSDILVKYEQGELKISFDGSKLNDSYFWYNFIKAIDYSVHSNMCNDYCVFRNGKLESKSLIKLLWKERLRFYFVSETNETKIKSILESARKKIIKEKEIFTKDSNAYNKKWKWSFLLKIKEN